MTIPRFPSLGILVALTACVAAPQPVAVVAPQAPAGAVVESVTPGLPGEKAGLQPGDVLRSWSCAASLPALPEPAGGDVRSPYDLLPLEIEQAPRRPVVLRGKRGDQERVWTVTAGEWGIETRPVAEDAAWSRHRQAKELAKTGNWAEADAAYQEALAALEREGRSEASAELLRKWAATFERRAAWDAAAERLERALGLDRSTGGRLSAARTLNALGITMAKKGDYPAAEEHLQQALAIREELAPGTVEVTGSLNNLGILARLRGDLDAAEEYLTRGEEIQRRLAPESADHALYFQNLGNLTRNRGDLAKTESYYRKALAIFEKTAPDGDGVAACLHNLSDVALQRGDLAHADHLLQRALELHQRGTPDDLTASGTLTGLGIVASRRGDLEAAEAYYSRAYEIQERLAPEGVEAAAGLEGLGIVAGLRGDYARARSLLQRSLAIKEKLAPGGPQVTANLQNLAVIEINSGALATAEGFLNRALGITEANAPDSLVSSEILRNLGEVAARRGQLPEAKALHLRALGIQQRLAPGTTGEAESLHYLGRVERQSGGHEAGTRYLCEAIDSLDRQRTILGGTVESRGAFEISVGDYYHACLEGLIELRREADAFHALERGRARSFLALLAERDVRPVDLPAELAAERRQVHAEYDRAQSELAGLRTGANEAESERLRVALRDLRIRQQAIADRIRHTAPRSAALQEPEPLDVQAARLALDPGTLLLAYAVGTERTWLFAVTSSGAAGPGLAVFPVAAGREALQKEVESFRQLLKLSTSERAALQGQARRLYDLLVRPAEKQIAEARRLLVSPDGPLHTLPFAALMRGDRYLVEQKPIHSVLSTTVYAELARTRPGERKAGEQRFVAFADPAYPAPEGLAEPVVREAVRNGLSLTSLPASRQEVEGIAGLFSTAQTYLGREATEEKAKSLGPETRLVHFACHGLLDERFPLNSSLALAISEHPAEGQDNGLLQAWEIFESVRLDADLVTLSACDTALGKEMGGEGLVGLTRAFQYAGARSVLASLWSVSDVSTADLMQRFYGHLRAGKPKDEALQAAQIELLRSPQKRLNHPFHWAAFQLTGDWR